MMHSSLPLISSSALQVALNAAKSAAPEGQASTTNATSTTPFPPSFEALVAQVQPKPPHYLLTLLAGKQSLQVLSELPLPLGSKLSLQSTPIPPAQSTTNATNTPSLRLLALSLPSQNTAEPFNAAAIPPALKEFVQSRELLNAPAQPNPNAAPASTYTKPASSAPTAPQASIITASKPSPTLELLKFFSQSLETTSTASTEVLNSPQSQPPKAALEILKNWQQNLPTLTQLAATPVLKQAITQSGLSFEHQLWQILSQASQSPTQSASRLFQALWQKAPIQQSGSTANTENNSAPPLNSAAQPASRIANILQSLKAKLEAPLSPTEAKEAKETKAAAPAMPSLLQSLLAQDHKAVLGRALLLWAKALAQSGQLAETRSLPLSPHAGANLPEGFKLLQSALTLVEHEQTQRLQQSDSWQASIPLFYRQGAETREIKLHIDKEQTEKKAGKKAAHSWRLRLYFDLKQLGQLDIDLRLDQTKLSATFWSKQANTLSLLHQALAPLRKTLGNMGVEVSELNAKHGQLPEPSRNRIERNWINEKV